MKNDYMLGQDIASIKEAIQCIEMRLRGLENSMTALRSVRAAQPAPSCHMPSIVSMPCPAPQVGGKHKELVTVPIDWRAADENSSGLYSLPDGSAQISLFAYMLPQAQVNINIPKSISDAIFDDVYGYYQDNKSATQNFTYAPSGFPVDACVLGFYNERDSEWNWIYVEFLHVVDNPNARFSRSYGIDGTLIASSFGEVSVAFYVKDNYKFIIKYEDLNQDYGLRFTFGSFYR